MREMCDRMEFRGKHAQVLECENIQLVILHIEI